MLKSLSLEFLIGFAEQYNINPAILLAIAKKESNCNHHDGRGIIQQRFEVHIYNGFLSVLEGKLKRHPSLPGLSSKWIKKHSKSEARLLSTSYGVFQIMGWHYPMLGYDSIGGMLEDWEIEEVHIKDFCLFCIKYNNGKFLKALQELDFERIALMYNGAGYKRNNYDTDLKKFFEIYKSNIGRGTK